MLATPPRHVETEIAYEVSQVLCNRRALLVLCAVTRHGDYSCRQELLIRHGSILQLVRIYTYRFPARGVEPRLMPQRGVGCGLLAMMFHLEHVAALAVDGRSECCASRTVDCREAYMRALVTIGL